MHNLPPKPATSNLSSQRFPFLCFQKPMTARNGQQVSGGDIGLRLACTDCIAAGPNRTSRRANRVRAIAKTTTTTTITGRELIKLMNALLITSTTPPHRSYLKLVPQMKACRKARTIPNCFRVPWLERGGIYGQQSCKRDWLHSVCPFAVALACAQSVC